MKNLMNCHTVCVYGITVYYTAGFTGHATVIIPDAEALVSCDDYLVTSADRIVYCGNRSEGEQAYFSRCFTDILVR